VSATEVAGSKRNIHHNVGIQVGNELEQEFGSGLVAGRREIGIYGFTSGDWGNNAIGHRLGALLGGTCWAAPPRTSTETFPLPVCRPPAMCAEQKAERQVLSRGRPRFTATDIIFRMCETSIRWDCHSKHISLGSRGAAAASLFFFYYFSWNTGMEGAVLRRDIESLWPNPSFSWGRNGVPRDFSFNLKTVGGRLSYVELQRDPD